MVIKVSKHRQFEGEDVETSEIGDVEWCWNLIHIVAPIIRTVVLYCSVILFVLGEIFDPKCFDTSLQLIWGLYIFFLTSSKSVSCAGAKSDSQRNWRSHLQYESIAAWHVASILPRMPWDFLASWGKARHRKKSLVSRHQTFERIFRF